MRSLNLKLDALSMRSHLTTSWAGWLFVSVCSAHLLSVAYATPKEQTSLAQLPFVSGECQRHAPPAESVHLEMTRDGVTLNQQRTSLKLIDAQLVSRFTSKSAGHDSRGKRADETKRAIKFSARSDLAMREIKPWLQALINAGVTELFVATHQSASSSDAPLWLSLKLDQRKRERVREGGRAPIDAEPIKGPFISLSASGLKVYREGKPDEMIKLGEFKQRAPKLLMGEVSLSVRDDVLWSAIVEVASYACDSVELTWNITILKALGTIGVGQSPQQVQVFDDSASSTRALGLGLDAQAKGWVGRGRGNRAPRVAKVKLSPPQVTGELPAQVVHRLMRRRLSMIRDCYQRQLNLIPDLKGKLSLRFEITPRGRVRAVELKSEQISQSSLKSCIRSRVKRLKFPQAQAGESTSVQYRMMLRSRKRPR